MSKAFTPPSRTVRRMTGTETFAPPPPRAPDIVPGLIPAAGLILVAGRPSEGKSSLMRSLSFAVAMGEPPLKSGAAQAPADVLYLDYEGSHDLNHAEQLKMFPGNQPSLDRLSYFYEAPRFDQLWNEIEKWREESDNPRVVVIDIFGKAQSVTMPRGRRLMQPEIDNLTLEPLKLWAEKHGIAVFILVHINPKKPKPTSDPIGSLGVIIGSSAIVGTPDCRMLLRRTATGTTLFATGRALPSDRHVALDYDAGWFSVIGDVDVVSAADNETKIIKALSDAHAAMREGHSSTDMMKGKELSDATGIPYESDSKRFQRYPYFARRLVSMRI